MAALLCGKVAADLGPADTVLVESILAIRDDNERLRTLNSWIQLTLATTPRARQDPRSGA
jgi:hypothetical protein